MEEDLLKPLDKYGNGNCCPNCQSQKIDVCHQFALEVYYDLITQRERFYIQTENGIELKSNPSNKDKARRYISSQFDSQVWSYKCRRCGWLSEPFVP